METKEPDHPTRDFNILLVEDNVLFRYLVKEKLEDRFPSVRISEVMDGEEALKNIEAFPPDLIFMDIKLPGENGIEITKRIKRQHPMIPVIILTAYDLPEYRDASLQYADYFLSKDAWTEKVVKIVQSLSSVRA